MIGTITIKIITSKGRIVIMYGNPSVRINLRVSNQLFGLMPSISAFSVFLASLKADT